MENKMITKEKLLEAFQHNIIIKHHAYNKLKERNLNIHDIEEAFLNDEIIEQYLNDYPFQSVLILGFTRSEKPLHIVCAPTDLGLMIITVYFPKEDVWEQDWKTRRN